MTQWDLEAKNPQKSHIVINTFSILEKLNSNMNSMAQTVAAATEQKTDNVNIFDELDDLAFESNILALNASLNEIRANEDAEKEAIQLAKKVNDIAMKAADTTKILHGVATAYREARQSGQRH